MLIAFLSRVQTNLQNSSFVLGKYLILYFQLYLKICLKCKAPNVYTRADENIIS